LKRKQALPLSVLAQVVVVVSEKALAANEQGTGEALTTLTLFHHILLLSGAALPRAHTYLEFQFGSQKYY